MNEPSTTPLIASQAIQLTRKEAKRMLGPTLSERWFKLRTRVPRRYRITQVTMIVRGKFKAIVEDYGESFDESPAEQLELPAATT